MIQPVYGSMSQWDVHAMMIRPFNIVSAARSSYCFGSKMTEPPELPAPLPGNDAWIGRRAAEQFGAGREVERVQALEIRGTGLGHRDDVDRAVWTARSIDDRRRRDPDFRRDLRAASRIARRLAGAERGRAPEDAASGSVQRVHAVVLRHGIQDICARPAPGSRGLTQRAAGRRPSRQPRRTPVSRTSSC